MENKTIKFLWDASQLLRMKINSKTMGNILCQVSEKYLRTAAGTTDHYGKFNSSEVCKFCGNGWVDGNFQFYFLGHKHSMRKRKSKLDKKSELSCSTKKYLSFYRKRKDNVMVKKCLVCKAVTKCGMSKPKHKIESNVSSNYLLNNVNPNSVNKKHKRKSKTKSYAGLSPAAVLQARSSSCQIINIPKANEEIIKNIISSNNPVKNKVVLRNPVINEEEKDLLMTSPRTSFSDNLSTGITLKTTKSNIKKRKPLKLNKKDNITKNTSKKKSFVSQFLDLL